MQLHRTAMAEVAARAERTSWTLDEGAWLARFAPDYNDLQSAFDSAVSNRDARVAGAIGEVLEMIESRRAVSGPQMRRHNAAMTLLECTDAKAKARLWNCIAPGTLHLAPRSMSRLQAAKARLLAWQELGEPEQIYVALGYLAIAQARAGERTSADETLAAMQAHDDPAWSPRRRWELPWRRAHVREYQGDFAGCIKARLGGLAIAESAADDSLAEVSRIGLAEAHLLLDDHEAALTLLSPLVSRLRERRDDSRLAWTLDLLCIALLLDRDVEQARSVAQETLGLHRQLDTSGWASLVLALLAARLGEHSIAAKLLGHAESWFKSREAVPEPIFQHIMSVAKTEVDEAVGVDSRTQMWTTGSALSQAGANALADKLIGQRRTRASDVLDSSGSVFDNGHW